MYYRQLKEKFALQKQFRPVAMGISFKQIILLLLYFSWGSQCKNTKVDCHSLLQWTILCQTLTSRDMPGEISIISDMQGLPWWLRWQRICMQSGRSGFNPWVGKIQWRRAWQPTPVFLPGESPGTEEPGGLQSMGLHIDRTEQQSTDMQMTPP